MPTTYTHFRFGKDCLRQLDRELRNMILPCRQLYNFGVHGPDIFFYYHPLKSNDVSKFGNAMHHRPAREFFACCRSVYQEYEDCRDEMLSYIFGFLSHFALDSTCHGYIDRKSEVSGVSHNRIEAVYDGYLMELDGAKDPRKVNRGFSLKPSIETAQIISRFFDFNDQTILTAIKGQKQIMDLLYSPFGLKKTMLRALIQKLHLSGGFDDLFIDRTIPSDCMDSNIRLDKLRKIALDRYALLAPELYRYLTGTIDELSNYFDHDFEPWPDYQNIPILSYKDELNYQPA